jgi:hypothetical protein
VLQKKERRDGTDAHECSEKHLLYSELSGLATERRAAASRVAYLACGSVRPVHGMQQRRRATLTGHGGRGGERASGGESVAHEASAAGKVVASPGGVGHGGVYVEAADAAGRVR